jgi:SAM-dependent methyltransferase
MHPLVSTLHAAVRGNRRLCVMCATEVDAWVPFGSGSSEISEFLQRVEIVGSNVERYGCPHCASTDRERHLRLFLEERRVLEPIRSASVLHIAPEPRLAEYLQRHELTLYVQGDLRPGADPVRRIDVQHIPYPDRTFDLVVCNHVLEHVADPMAAIREMHRVLKPAGRVICQTPFARRLTNTLEDPLLQAPSDRVFFYGQEDHVRLFGTDIVQVLRQAGFTGRMVSHREILPSVDPELLGVNEQEPFFDFVRHP